MRESGVSLAKAIRLCSYWWIPIGMLVGTSNGIVSNTIALLLYNTHQHALEMHFVGVLSEVHAFKHVKLDKMRLRYSVFFLFYLSWHLKTCSGIMLINNTTDSQQEYRPEGPLVLCKFLPKEFIECEDPIDHKGNKTAKEETGFGCVKFGGSRYEEVEKTKVSCTVLPYIECYGPKTFTRDGVPCIKYSDHYFATTLLYSILLGFLGMDRFCLGQSGTAVGKLFTLGGVGVWWIFDVILLVTGSLQPEDGSNWNPYV